MTTAAQLLAAPPVPPQARSAKFATGFEPLDDLINGGFRAQDLGLVGGRPGIGKTIAALQWARWMAMQGQTAIFACYQHSPAALVRRLLAIELRSLARPDEISELARLRALGQEVVLGAIPMARFTADPLGEEAYLRLREYGSLLHLVRPPSDEPGVGGLARVVSQHRSAATALFVDSVQRVPSHDGGSDPSVQLTHVAAQLKELAMVTEVPVIAVSGTDGTGLAAHRVHLRHLDGNPALAHEADIAILLNEKTAVVGRPSHLTLDPSRTAADAKWVVFSVEKNREGAPDLNLEFRKDFANFRFDPRGGFVSHPITALAVGSGDD